MDLADYFWVLLLIMCLIQFSNAWIYPSASEAMVNSLRVTKVLGVPFQTSLWLLIVAGLAMLGHQIGFDSYVRVVRLVLPYWGLGMLAALFGFNPPGSVVTLLLWALMITGATCTALSIPGNRIIKLMCGTLGGVMVLSVLVVLLLPDVGKEVYGTTTVWRGAFVSKNTYGWVAALTLVISVAALDRDNRRWTASAALLSVVGLLGSGSKGAFVAALATLCYLGLIRWSARRLSPGFGVFAVLGVLVTATVAALLVMPMVVEMLGRDMTLTGRTQVWGLYFNSMMKSPWLGEGPGAYSSLSPFTAPLAAKLQSLGNIVTPHNVFLGVLGDTGLFGLCTFMLIMGYLTIVLPLYRPGRGAWMCAAVGFQILSHGLVETHEVLSPGLGWFLLMLSYTVSCKEQREQRNAAAMAEQQPTARTEQRHALREVA
jgi:O-antigen ligase